MKEIEDFYKVYYSDMKDFFVEYNNGKPGLTEENYWVKVLEKSAICDEDFQTIENKLGFKLPELFKKFYKTHYSLEKDFDTGGLFIAGNRKGDNLSTLSSYFFDHGLSEDMIKLNLIPFGLYNDGWYVCLDMNGNKDNPKVMLFEISNWEAGRKAISHRPWFSDFSSFLKCITDSQKTGSTDNFKTLDPNNNYSTAYNYWKNDWKTRLKFSFKRLLNQ